MPVDKNQMLRYTLLDKCFKDLSKEYKMDDLVECCNRELKKRDKTVSKRTVQGDIKTLQNEPYNAEFDEELYKHHIYRYADTSFHLEVVEKLTAPDRDALNKTIELLRDKYSGPEEQNPQWQWMLMTLQSIASDRPLETAEAYVSFENNGAYSGNVNFTFLLESIISQHPLKIRYRPFGQTLAKDYKIHPYYLKQYNSRWFLFASVDENMEISNFALDRILKVTPWKHAYRPTDVDFKDYFKNMIGVSRNKDMPIKQIKLKVSNSRYPYVETKPFSEKQKVETHDDQTHTITFPMKINNELTQNILSFGEDIEVLQPQHLRQLIAEKVTKMNNKYSIAQKDCAQE